MKAIIAMDKNRAIGKQNQLPWPSIKDDFRWFKEFTTNKILVVGHTTFSTLPKLKNRNLIVLTTTPYKHADDYNVIYNSAHTYRNAMSIVNLDVELKGELIVIGGAKTYELFIPYIREFYVTHVNGEFDADTYMSPFEHLFDKQEVIREFEGGHKVLKYSKTV